MTITPEKAMDSRLLEELCVKFEAGMQAKYPRGSVGQFERFQVNDSVHGWQKAGDYKNSWMQGAWEGFQLHAALSQAAPARNPDSIVEQTFFLVKKPGMVPRVGRPMGAAEDSLKEWVAANPDAEITVVQLVGEVTAKCELWVDSSQNFLAIHRDFGQSTPANQQAQAESKAPEVVPGGCVCISSRDPVCNKFCEGIQGLSGLCVNGMADGTMCGHKRACHGGQS